MSADQRRDVAGDASLQALSTSWQLGLFIGIVTLLLGIVVALEPEGSLNVISVIIGIVFIVSGIFRAIRSLDPNAQHRFWLAIIGLLSIVLGVVLIRHLHETKLLLALIVGIVWIVQGLVDLIGGITAPAGSSRGWPIFLGIVTLVAGIVVVAWPVTSLATLAVLLGIWFIIIGLLQIVVAFFVRSSLKHA